jgi:cephalosporin-C deacetylase
VFAAFNSWRGSKDIRIWPYNQHNGGETYQTLEKIKFMTARWR